MVYDQPRKHAPNVINLGSSNLRPKFDFSNLYIFFFLQIEYIITTRNLGNGNGTVRSRNLRIRRCLKQWQNGDRRKPLQNSSRSHSKWRRYFFVVEYGDWIGNWIGNGLPIYYRTESVAAVWRRMEPSVTEQRSPANDRHRHVRRRLLAVGANFSVASLLPFEQNKYFLYLFICVVVPALKLKPYKHYIYMHVPYMI